MKNASRFPQAPRMWWSGVRVGVGTLRGVGDFDFQNFNLDIANCDMFSFEIVNLEAFN